MDENEDYSDSSDDSAEWRDSKVFPDYVKDWDEFKNSDEPEKFFSQLASHRKMLGQSIRIPQGDVSDEQRAEFYQKIQNKVDGLMRVPDLDNADSMRETFQKLGLPENAAQYSVPEIEGYTPQESNVEEIRKAAHEAGLTQSQFKAFVSKMFGAENDAAIAAGELSKAEAKQLYSEWGEATEQRKGIAQRVAEKTGAPESLVNALKDGNADSATLKWLYGLSKQFGGEENQFTNGEPSIASVEELRGELFDLMGNKQGAYWDNSHPGHKAAVDRGLDLRAKIINLGGSIY